MADRPGVRFAGDTDPTEREILQLLDPVSDVDFGVAGMFIVSVDGAHSSCALPVPDIFKSVVLIE